MNLITDNFLAQLIAEAVRCKTRFWICSYSLQFGRGWRSRDLMTFFQQLARQKLTGADVRLLLATPYCQPRLTYRNTNAAKEVISLGIPMRYYVAPASLHAKFYILDPDSFIIGSHNLTFSSLNRNIELSAVLSDSATYSRLTNLYLKLWTTSKPANA